MPLMTCIAMRQVADTKRGRERAELEAYADEIDDEADKAFKVGDLDMVQRCSALAMRVLAEHGEANLVYHA